jgi:putative hydrolase of the HAD superfamily
MAQRFSMETGRRRSGSAPQLCLVFDLDDTLFLEREYVCSGFEAVGEWVHRAHGVPDFAERAWRLFEDGYRERIFDVVVRERGWDPTPSLIAQLVKVYRTHFPRITMLPDALDCLLRFYDTAMLALITDGPAASQRQKVRALKLHRFFDVIVLTGAWGEEFSKPHLRAFQFVQAKLKPFEGRFIYVADNPAKDFIAPIALGWETVRVRRALGLYARHDTPSGAEPDVELGDLSGLPDFVYGNTPQIPRHSVRR